MTIELEHPEVDPLAPRRDPDRAPVWAGPAAGLAAGGAAVFTGMLVAAIIDVTSPIDAVGSEFIDRVAEVAEGTGDRVVRHERQARAAHRHLGHARPRRRSSSASSPAAGRWSGSSGSPCSACSARPPPCAGPSESVGAALPPLLGAVVGWRADVVPDRHRPRGRRRDATRRRRSRAPRGWDRRRFLVASGSAAGGGGGRRGRRRTGSSSAGSTGSRPHATPSRPRRSSRRRRSTAPARRRRRAAEATPAVARGPGGRAAQPDDAVHHAERRLLPDRHRAVGAAHRPRQAGRSTSAGWSTKPLSLSYDDLLARPQIERMVTIACVSNEVGGDLIGNAVWQGVLPRRPLDEAGVRPAARAGVHDERRRVDLRLPGRRRARRPRRDDRDRDERRAAAARARLPGAAHRPRPVRLRQRDEVAEHDRAEPRGTTTRATGCRVDGRATRRSRRSHASTCHARGDTVPAGTTTIAGIAWAQHTRRRQGRGQRRRGPSGARRRSAPRSPTTRGGSGRCEWDATPGEHVVQVRATDKSGYTQTEEVARPDPDGATGWHTRTFDVE